MWCVRTASRLHLGLLSLPCEGDLRPDRHGEPRFVARRYGGVGLMIDAPGLVVRAQTAEEWCADGPLAERALAFARQIVASFNSPHLPPRRLLIESAPREHVGFGVGTQLGLAVARALTVSWDREASVVELARLVHRGRRSALGVHGFAHGGFLVEAGKSSGQELSPLVARMEWPAEWRVLVAVPSVTPGCHGPAEQAAFECLRSSPAATEALCRLVLLDMLPALIEGDLQAFGEAVHDFNARVGELFAPIQGSVYAGAAVAELVDLFRRENVAGVGQSSWGPVVFAFLEDEERARSLRERLPPGTESWIARGVNHGATLERG